MNKERQIWCRSCNRYIEPERETESHYYEDNSMGFHVTGVTIHDKRNCDVSYYEID